MLDKLKQANITLSVKEYEISQNKVKFAGQVVDDSGLYADKDNIKALIEMRQPTNKSKIRCC